MNDPAYDELSSYPAGALIETDDPESKNWGMLAHLFPIIGIFFTGGFLSFIGPLIVWQVKKESSPFAAQEAKEALNFQLSLLIYLVVGSTVFGLLSIIVIGLPLLFALIGGIILMNLVLPIVAGLQAAKGQPYRYPACLRFIA